ncbi:MAG: YCF48-related protein [Candidatus Sulfotelmatobacter sp.]
MQSSPSTHTDAGLATASWLPEDRVGRRKIVVFVLALALLVALTFFALGQHAPPQFARPASFFSKDWWLLPHEQNSVLRPAVTDQRLLSVSFPKPQLGWAVGDQGTILHTEDGGTSWTTQASNTIAFLRSVSFATPQLGWAAGDHGTILHTEDGGKNWKIGSRRKATRVSPCP